MTRRPPSYLGGSTVHIPGRDSWRDDDGPSEALRKAREQTAQESLGSETAGEESRALMIAFFNDLLAGCREVQASGERAGSSLSRFDALNWRERLSHIVGLARRGGNDRQAKQAQAVMGELADTERRLREAQRYPEEVRYDDAVFWTMALVPSPRR